MSTSDNHGLKGWGIAAAVVVALASSVALTYPEMAVEAKSTEVTQAHDNDPEAHSALHRSADSRMHTMQLQQREQQIKIQAIEGRMKRIEDNTTAILRRLPPPTEE